MLNIEKRKVNSQENTGRLESEAGNGRKKLYVLQPGRCGGKKTTQVIQVTQEGGIESGNLKQALK